MINSWIWVNSKNIHISKFVSQQRSVLGIVTGGIGKVEALMLTVSSVRKVKLSKVCFIITCYGYDTDLDSKNTKYYPAIIFLINF